MGNWELPPGVLALLLLATVGGGGNVPGSFATGDASVPSTLSVIVVNSGGTVGPSFGIKGQTTVCNVPSDGSVVHDAVPKCEE